MGLFGFQRRKRKKLKEIWPVTEAGQKVEPAYLTHTGGAPMDAELILSLLEAYGIPAVCQYPNDGAFGQLIIGVAGGGVDIFVPETMLEDAKNLLSAEPDPDGGTDAEDAGAEMDAGGEE